MFRRVVAIVLMLALPTLSFAVTKGIEVNAPCNPNQLGMGQNTNDVTYFAMQNTLGPNWGSSNPGAIVVAKYSDGTQVTYTVTAAGTLEPSTGCVAPDPNLWTDYSGSSSGTVSESDHSEDFNGDGDTLDTISVDSGTFPSLNGNDPPGYGH